MMTDESEFNGIRDGLEPMKDTPIAHGPAIGAIALNMALKYYDINTVQEGALYQQYKLEGKNVVSLHLEMVFETAIRIERHLLAASDRIAALVIEAVAGPIDDDDGTDDGTNAAPENDAKEDEP